MSDLVADMAMQIAQMKAMMANQHAEIMRLRDERDWLKAELRRLMELTLTSSGSDDGGNTRSSFG